jgi:hypothetical protein
LYLSIINGAFKKIRAWWGQGINRAINMAKFKFKGSPQLHVALLLVLADA